MTKKEQKQKDTKKKETKPKSLSNWFGSNDDDFEVMEHIRKKGTFKATRIG